MIPVFFGLGLLLLAIQTTIFHLMPAWLGRPDLLFLLLVFIALYCEPFRGLILTLLLGLLVDVLSGIYLGVIPLVYLLFFLGTKALTRHLALQDSINQVHVVVVGFLTTTAVGHLLTSLLGPEYYQLWNWSLLLQNLVILSVICLPFLHLCHHLQRLIGGTPPLSVLTFLSFKRRSSSANRFKS